MPADDFKTILATLPPTDHLEAIVLLGPDGEPMARLDNQPGTAGSVRVYHALVEAFGHIDRKAARKGLVLYAEHTEDARRNPGRHPNIDRLLSIAEGAAPGLRVRLVLKG